MPFGGWRSSTACPACLAAMLLLAGACSSPDDTDAGAAATVEAVAPSDVSVGSDQGSAASSEASSLSSSTTALVVGSSPDSESDPSGDAASATSLGGETTGGDATTGSGSSTDPTSSATATSATGTSATTSPPNTALATTSPAVTSPPSSSTGAGGGSLRDTVIGTGSPASCTSRGVVDAVAAGGFITFDCGPNPVVITLDQTAKVVNANGPEIVLDGGGLVTLSGGGSRRILYMNTCDQAQGWTTSHCNNQDHPRLTVQNLTFVDGNSTGETLEGGGGGAIFVRGGQLRVVNSTFLRNRCDNTGPDVGGAAIRVLSQFDGRPVEVVSSTFGGAPGQGGVCSNGGALSSIGVSWRIVGSVFTHNRAIGNGANPAKAGTPGGGSGGAIYTDGNRFTVDIRNSTIEDNEANEGGGAVFFVSNDRSGTMSITGSTLRRNPSAGFETSGFPGIFFLGNRTPTVTGSTLE